MSNNLTIPNTWLFNKYHTKGINNAGLHIRRRYCESASVLKDPFAIDMHWHDYVQIWYTVDGEYCNSIYGRDNWLGEGSVLIVPPFVSHDTSGNRDQSVTVISLDVTIDVIKRIVPPEKQHIFLEPSPHGAQASLLLQDETRQKVSRFLNRMYEENNANPQRSMVLYQNELSDFFSIVADAVTEHSPLTPSKAMNEKNYQTIKLSLEYLQKHYKEPIRLGDMCKLTAMSQAGFCRLFKEYTGNTFTQYLYMLRIPKAANVIGATDLPIKKIMKDFGFNTKSNFIRLFKAVYGCTPSDIRRRARGKL